MAAAEQLFKRTPGAFVTGVVLMLFVFALAVLGMLWTPQDPQAMDLTRRLASFSSTYWLGTDHFGRDVLSLLLAGLGKSLQVAAAAIGLGASIGIALGFTAAISGSRIFGVLSAKLTDFMFIFPALLTAIFLATLYGPSLGNAILSIALFNVPVFFRLSRSLGLSLQARDYVKAARALGQRRSRVLLHHILPASAGVLVTQLSIQFGLALLAEAALSYLGLGVPPPLPSLGRMLQDAQTYMISAPHLALLPGGLIALTVLGCNLLGDGLRDMLDTRRTQLF